MRGRVKGEIIFDTVARRTTLVTAYQAWKVGKPILLENNRLIDEDGDPPVPTPPTIRFDVIFVTDLTTRALRDWLVGLPRTGVVRIFLCLHRCTRDDLNPETNVANEYLVWP